MSNIRKPKKQKPVQQVELSEKNIKLRVVLFIAALVVAMISLAVFLFSLLNKDPGWKSVPNDTKDTAIGEELVFSYNLGQSGVDATAEYKRLSALYEQTTDRLYRMFAADQAYDGVNNLYTISRNPGQVIEVDPILYRALKLTEERGDRMLYLAPVYREYDNLFYSDAEHQAADRDPYRSEDAAEYIRTLMTYVRNPEAIRLELLENNRVRLNVSAEYRDFLAKYEIDTLIDFYTLRNAFIVDAAADALIEAGYTRGNLTSYDGYTRNLDNSGTVYGYNVPDIQENTVYPAAQLAYHSAAALVCFRDYPINSMDAWRFYVYNDGSSAFPYIDPTDGLYRSATHTLIGFSQHKGCAEMALRLLPIYTAKTLDTFILKAMQMEDITTVWCADRKVYYTGDNSTTVQNLYNANGMTYEKVYAG